MTYTTAPTAVTGPLSSTLLADYKDGIDYWAGHTTVSSGKKSLLICMQTVAQSLTSGSWAALTFDAEAEDYDSGHGVTSKFTVSQPGILLVATASYGFAANSSGQRSVGIRKNGTGTSQPTHFRTDIAPPTTAGVVGCSGMIPVVATDYIEVVAFQNSGSALLTNVATTDAQSQLHLVLISL